MNICIILYDIFSRTKHLMCFSQQHYEIASYSHIKDEKHESQAWKNDLEMPWWRQYFYDPVKFIFAIYSDLCLSSVSSKHAAYQLLQTFASKGNHPCQNVGELKSCTILILLKPGLAT